MTYFLIVSIGLLSAVIIMKLLLLGSIVAVFPVTQGAMFHPSAPIRVQTALNCVPMREGELFIDLGCGDGRVLIAAGRFGVHAIGYEINPFTYLLAWMRTLGKKNVTAKYGNFWRENLGEADIVFCYLFPDVMDKLAKKLAQELRPGARVISCNFPLPGWREEQILRPPSLLHGDPIYVYRVAQADSSPGR